jgi:sRNA-binding carbon storage regulator CsrA
MLNATMNEGEKLLLVDSIANQHGFIECIRAGGDRVTLGIDLPSTIGVVRTEVFKDSAIRMEKVREYFAIRSHDPYRGTICSGTISGTADVTKRGLVVGMLGSLLPEMETPLRLLIKTPDREWYVLNGHPVNRIPLHDYTRAEAELAKLFNKTNIRAMCDEIFGEQ